MSIVLLTGATGFIGQALVNQLCEQYEHRIVAVVRNQSVIFPCNVDKKLISDIAQQSDWSSILDRVDVVVHLAALAHVAHDQHADLLSSFRSVNVEATSKLARQAASVGVKRFIFLSSVGVNGNLTHKPFTENDAPHPVEPYAISKYEAEQELKQVSNETGIDIVIIRPPLVYGPNAPGNFAKLIRWAGKGMPLPLGAIHNKRSLVAVDNLVDLIITCINHPAAVNQVLLVSDGEDLSTTELCRRIAKALGKPARLLPVPQGVLEFGLKMFGKSGLARRLCGSLQVDISKTQELLGWTPPVSVEEGLHKTAEAYLQSK